MHGIFIDPMPYIIVAVGTTESSSDHVKEYWASVYQRATDSSTHTPDTYKSTRA